MTRQLVGAVAVALALAGGGCRRAAAPRGGLAAPALTPDEIALAEQLGAEELARWSRERDERLLDAVDPGEAAEHTRRISQRDIDDGHATAAQLFLQGEHNFDRNFTLAEGLGTGLLGRPRPALSRVENRAAVGGPDAISCRECHGRGGDDGHGELHQRAWLDGDGRHLASAHPRLPPHLAGLGFVERLAAEMSAELGAAVAGGRSIARASGAPSTTRLVAKGVDFGEVVVGVDGSVDARGVRGVDADLVVRPFGWKGTHADLRSFVAAALPQHMGLEPLPAPGHASPELASAAPTYDVIEVRRGLFDRDRDGVPGEVVEGQLTSLVVYLALLDVPVVLPPRSAEVAAAWRAGVEAFRRAGCEACHRPSLPLASVELRVAAPGSARPLVVDLVRDNQVRPRLDHVDASRPGVDVPLYSDLRRHDLGAALAEAGGGGGGGAQVGGRPGALFLTRPLWGLGDRGPYYLHDGRARSLDEAIRLHGGEAAPAAATYAALSDGDRRAIAVFLRSLRRMPQGRIAP